MSRPVSRRALLRGALLASGVLTGGALAGCSGGAAPASVLATGEPGGFYAEFGELLALATRDSDRPLRTRNTGGSTDNAQLVADGGAALGLMLSDVALAARAGTAPFRAPIDLLAVGRVYENYLQLVVPAESPVRSPADLAGRPVSLGAAGSGAAVAGARLVDVAGIPVRARLLGLADAVAALSDGRIDALLWSGGLPTPALDGLAARRPIRLLALTGYLDRLRDRYGPAYTAASIPAGVYGAGSPVPTIGVANLLVGTAGSAAGVAGTVVRTLVGRAPELVPASALGAQYLDQPSLVDTGSVPLHPAAAAAYLDLHG